jgi:PhoH-like ATPase
MSHPTYVLDTNILLHDPNSMHNFPDENVVIPMVVLEELNQMKKMTDERGRNARFVLRFIDALGQNGDLYQGIKMENGSTIRVLVELKTEKNGFPLIVDKNRVLHTAFQLKNETDVVLVSKDFLVRVKGEALGIKTQNYRAAVETFDTLYTGVRRLDVDKSVIDQFFATGVAKVNVDPPFLPNEYCVLSGDQNSSAVAKYSVKKKGLVPLINVDRDVWGVKPLNVEQRCALDLLLRDDIKLVSFVGQAGTGKTLLALACGLKKVFDEEVYSRILISRPIMPLGKDIGYLPGTKEEKLYHWMQPIYDNLEFLCESTCGAGDPTETKNYILESKKIEMEAVTYIRGRTLPRMYIIIDEAQNLTPHEIKTIISRAGHGTKVVLMGDPSQIDNPYLDKDSNALTYLIGKFKSRPIFGHICLEKTERSELAAIAAEVL